METYFDRETGTTTSIIKYKNQEFIGEARCAPEDMEHMSESVGTSLAEQRVYRKYLKFIKEFEIKPRLAGLNQLLYSMNTSKKFSPKGYEVKMLYRQIRICQDDLTQITEDINYSKQFEQKLIRYFTYVSNHS